VPPRHRQALLLIDAGTRRRQIELSKTLFGRSTADHVAGAPAPVRACSCASNDKCRAPPCGRHSCIDRPACRACHWTSVTLATTFWPLADVNETPEHPHGASPRRQSTHGGQRRAVVKLRNYSIRPMKTVWPARRVRRTTLLFFRPALPARPTQQRTSRRSRTVHLAPYDVPGQSCRREIAGHDRGRCGLTNKAYTGNLDARLRRRGTFPSRTLGLSRLSPPDPATSRHASSRSLSSAAALNVFHPARRSRRRQSASVA
jgi:hypothetical protein